MAKLPPKPAPAQTEQGQQKDDNIDDLGRKPDGSTLDQPGTKEPRKQESRRPSGFHGPS